MEKAKEKEEGLGRTREVHIIAAWVCRRIPDNSYQKEYDDSLNHIPIGTATGDITGEIDLIGRYRTYPNPV